MMNRLASIGKKIGLKINVHKTEVMRTTEACTENLYLDGHVIKNCNTFIYLRAIIKPNGSLKDEFDARLKEANQVMGMLRTVWKSRRLMLYTKLTLYKTC